MKAHLNTRRQLADAQMCVGITGEQEYLEEQHRRGPYGRPAPEPGQDVLGDERLHLKQQERPHEDGQRVGKHPRLTLRRKIALCPDLKSGPTPEGDSRFPRRS